ncbi:hydroxypyruvate isomerase family protein [Thermoactinospora rubra]|uniref:hydroxypyruvate isomerase family protein n=1 Tax=Thermoactinospora rubra TaxID=1088767 RepID=UPI000A11A7A8|nr:TIM barrel protein [Thermoactinospora rubra]
MRFDVNCSILFTHLPVLQRPEAVRSAGFDGVEFWWPFAAAVPGDKEVDAFVAAVEDAGVRLVGLNFADDIPEGGRGLFSRPADVTRLRDNIDVAVGIAGRLGCKALNALYGNRAEGVEPRQQDELALENLRLAARKAASIGAVVLVEALNGYESPSYPLVSARAALEVVDAVGEPNVRFLCDLYHLARMGEDLEAALRDPRVGHVQIADNPGRGRPGTGELPLAELLKGYDGWVGLEYKDPDLDFDWMSSWELATTTGKEEFDQ